MLSGELTRAQRMSLFVDLCNEDTKKAVGDLLIHQLPMGNHETKLAALPDFVQAAITHLGGAEIFGAQSVRQMLGLIPSSKSGNEIAVVETITTAHNFLSHDKI